jgi:hypothetical protein
MRPFRGLLGTSDASRTAGDARAPAGAAAAWCAQHPDGGECRCYASPASASQSLDELEFVRSACHAAQVGALDKLRTILSRTPGAVGSDGATGARVCLLLRVPAPRCWCCWCCGAGVGGRARHGGTWTPPRAACCAGHVPHLPQQAAAATRRCTMLRALGRTRRSSCC